VKRISFLIIVCIVALFACNNEAKDSVEKADSSNEVKQDSATINPQAIVTDEESTMFLVKAANSGMAEVQMGELAQQKAVNQDVKNFGAMMKTDHDAANKLVSELATQRNVTLPQAIGDIQKRDIDDLNKKNGTDFDKAYIKTMIRAHTETIDLFEQAANKSKDAEIKTFVNNTLPRLKNHLDSARIIQKKIN
jgi:putative membrane protein